MHLNIKKPSELKENACTTIQEIHAGATENDIAVWCPDCGAEIEFRSEWPIDIPITCGAIQDDNDVCKCRFIIPNTVAIEE